MSGTVREFLDKEGLKTLWTTICKIFVPAVNGTLTNPTITNGELNNPTILGGTLTNSTISEATSVSIKYPNNDTNSNSYDVWHKGNLRKQIKHARTEIENDNNQITLTPNCYDIIDDSVGTLTVTYGSDKIDVAEYNLQFTVKNETHNNNVVSSDKFIFPDNMYWAFGSNNTNEPIWINDTSYQINILNDIASYKMFRKPDDSKRIYYSLNTLVFADPNQSNKNALKLPYKKNNIEEEIISPGSLIGDDSNAFSLEECNYNIGRSLGKEGVIAFNAQIKSISNDAFNANDNTKFALIDGNYYPINNYPLNNTDYNQFGNIKSIILPDNVETIGERAFNSCTSLKTIYIPNNVSEVGVDAFYGCNELLEFDRGNETNEDSKYLLIVNNTVVACAPKGIENIGGEVTIPDGVTAISKNAFKNCTTVKSVNIPDSLTTIGYGAFQGCTNLETVTIPNNNVTIIDGWAFQGCSKLQSAPIGNSVETIGTYAFAGCTIISNITIPDSVTTIGTYAFSGCSNLTSIIFNTKTNNINIGSSAFYRCSKLTNVTFTKDVDLTKFNTTSLSSITNITDIHIDCDIKKSVIDANANKNTLCGLKLGNSTLHIGEKANYNGTGYTNSIESNTFVNCNINKVILYHINYIVLLINSAFSNCSGNILDIRCNIYDSSSSNKALFYNSKFSTLIISDNVTTIGDYAFYNCSSLTSVTIPDSITTIGEWAFYNCDSLTSVTLPDSVTTIGDYAFQSCSSLTNVTFNRMPEPHTNTITIGDYAFRYCSNIESVRTSTWSLKIWCEKFIFANGESNPLSNGNAYLYLGSSGVYPLRDLSIWSSSSNSESKVSKINDYAFYNYRGFSEAYNGSYSTFSVGFITSATNFKSGEIPNVDKGEYIEIGSYAFQGSIFSTVICKWARNNTTYRDNSIKRWLSIIKFKDDSSGLFSSSTELHFINTHDKNTADYDPYNEQVGEKDGNKRTQKLTTLDLSSIYVSKIQDYNLCNYKFLTSIIISDESTNKNGSEQTMQNNLTIGVGAFKDCSGLRKIVAYAGKNGGWTTLRKNGFINWCSTVFEDQFSNPLMALGANTTNTTTHVGFYNTLDSNDEITSINFSENDSLRTINAKAFINGRGITNVTIPKSVTTIGESAFFHCSLGTFTCYATTPPIISSTTFDANINLSIKVPSSSVSAYKAATNWITYASKISSM